MNTGLGCRRHYEEVNTMFVTIKRMTDADVAAECIQSHLKGKFPNTVFTISVKRWFLGKRITVKYVSGPLPDAKFVNESIDKRCTGATRRHDPEYGVYNEKASRLSGRYIGPGIEEGLWTI